MPNNGLDSGGCWPKESGGKVGSGGAGGGSPLVLAHVRASNRPSRVTGCCLTREDSAEMMGRVDDLFELKFGEPVLDVLDQVGHIRCRLYRSRCTDEDNPATRRLPGSWVRWLRLRRVFTSMTRCCRRLSRRGQRLPLLPCTVRDLPAGAGGQYPRAQDAFQWLQVSEDVCTQVQETKAAGGRVIAGTTSVRSLETAAGRGDCAL